MIRNKCKVIGITGGIASGKTTVKNILTDKGYTVIDSDIIARDVIEMDKPSYYELIEFFGDGVLNNNKSLDRKKLADIIFKDADKRKKIEEIMYPHIFKEILEQVQNECLKGNDIVFIDIPLLLENIKLINNSGIKFEKIWLVYCDRSTQLQRLISRENISKENANLRINAQMDIEEKEKMVDLVIENTSTKESLIKKVNIYLSELEQDEI